MSGQPKLKELVNALEDLTADEVRYMCTKLGVKRCTLKNIDADNATALNRIPEYLDAWLDRDRQPSWEKIAEALHSKKLNKIVLASKIMKKHCPIGLDLASNDLNPPGLNSSPSLSSEDENAYSSCLSHVSSSSSSREDDACSPRRIDPSGTATSFPILRLSEAKLEEYRFCCISKGVLGLVERFRSIVINANVHLTHKRLSPGEFYSFKLDITKLPTHLEKYRKLFFLQRKRRKIMQARSIQDVFDILDPYWNYVDYSLLEHIVEKYCDGEIRKEM